MATSVTETEIINGLMADPEYPRWSDLKMLLDQIIRLPNCLDPGHLARKMTFRGMIELQAEVCRLTLTTVFYDPDERMRKFIRGIGNSFAHLADVAGPLYDMYEPNPQQYYFKPDVRERYLAGNLTYADLLRLQPGILVPKYNP